MSKQSKSQWDFGELFPTEQTRQVLSVSDLTSQIRRLLEQRVGAVWVGGEVSNLRAQSSGHVYFTLKDAGAQLSCVCFRDAARESRALLADGQQVILQGDVTVYEVRGQYQLVVRQIELRGVGACQIAQKCRRPRTRVAAVRGQPLIHTQAGGGRQGHQSFSFHLPQDILIILHAGQSVLLVPLVLADQRLVRAEQRRKKICQLPAQRLLAHRRIGRHLLVFGKLCGIVSAGGILR